MKKYLCIFMLAALAACKNKSERNSGDEGKDSGFTTDTSVRFNPLQVPFSGPPPSFSDSAFWKQADMNNPVYRRQILFMVIDSAYYAITEIETIKNDLAAATGVELPVQERNIKTKALYKLNVIQNSLARQVDSALLTNLKTHTRELVVINQNLAANTEHLRNLSYQLNKVTNIMNRLTGTLAFCISRGLIKPPTPANLSPQEVKEKLL
jgi:hypothetical protein